MSKIIFTPLLILFSFVAVKAQNIPDSAKNNSHSILVRNGDGTEGDTLLTNYQNPHEFIIGAIVFDPQPTLDVQLLTASTGLSLGQKVRIPGDDISKAISNLWKQGYFEDIQVLATRAQDNFIKLVFKVTNKPVLSKFTFPKGTVTKSEADDIRKRINFVRGTPVTESTLERVKTTIKEFYVNKGYQDVDVNFPKIIPDTLTKQYDVIVTI